MIEVIDVSKKFKKYYDKATTLKERILFLRANKTEMFWALSNVSLTINEGETVGLIGENGSGKSTLLKLMTKIIYPTSGKIVTRGRVSSLLELGAGFHPDFTGRENIYINASIFGLNKREIDRRIDSIIEFSELADFIENPIRTYSSGMYMRLAFSVAVHVDPRILLIDEILAVGDVNFHEKCIDKIKEFKKEGVTIVIVSHDMHSIEKICDKVIWLEHGNVIEYGECEKVVADYLEHMKMKK